MNLRNRFSSFLPISSLLTLSIFAMLSTGSASCGTDHACFYFTQVEYDISKSCPSSSEALTFFQGTSCSTNIVTVDSTGTFDGSTCCYEVTESNDFITCGVGPDTPPPFSTGTSVVSSSGIGGTGGVGGAGGAGGTGGTGACSSCATFLTNTNPDPLCASSVSLYESYTDCLCNGACASVCKDQCTTSMSSMECETCSIDQTNGCGKEHDACLNDN